MGKKDRSKAKYQPNAPSFEHIHHPPQNPYYPDLSSSLLQPPPYSELTAPMVPNSVAMSQINRTNTNADYPRQSSVIIHQPQIANPYDYRAEKYHRRVRSYNCQVLLIAIMAIVLSIISTRLHHERPCVDWFTVHKVDNFDITIGKVREMHGYVAAGSVVIIVLCFLKSCTGRSKSYSCYLFLMGLCTFAMALFTGYLAYLSFYSPCVASVNDLFSKAMKSLAASVSENLPNPERGLFNEKNVLNYMEQDSKGVLIFIFDAVNFVFYFSAFLTASLMC